MEEKERNLYLTAELDMRTVRARTLDELEEKVKSVEVPPGWRVSSYLAAVTLIKVTSS